MRRKFFLIFNLIILISCGQGNKSQPEFSFFQKMAAGDSGYIPGPEVSDGIGYDEGYIAGPQEITSTDSIAVESSTDSQMLTISSTDISSDSIEGSANTGESSVTEEHAGVDSDYNKDLDEELNSFECKKPDIFRVKLNPISPASGTKGLLYFENALNPILSVEASDFANISSTHNPRSEFKSLRAAVGLVGFDLIRNNDSRLLITVDLKQKNLFGPSLHGPFTASFGTLGEGWNKLWFVFYVCDDRNGDGKCSDETVKNQITLRTPVFQACHVPSSIPVEVYVK